MAPTKAATPSDILRAAADIIEERGWTQGIAALGSGPTCAGIALDQAWSTLTGEEEWWGRNQTLHRAVCARIGTDSMIVWNDVPGRTVEEVLAMLRSVADELEGTG